MRTIQAHWDSYTEQVMQKYVTEIQYWETRLAFYGGAQAMLVEMVQIGDLSEEAAMAVIDGLNKEIDAFVTSYIDISKLLVEKK